MKKLFAMAVALVFAFGANAQIAKGEMVIGAGAGLGNSVYSSSVYDNVLLPINLDFEVGVAEALFGVDGLSLGVGAALSYTQAKDDYTNLYAGLIDGEIGFKYASYIVGAKGYFHYDFGVENLDTYAAITLGYNIASAKSYGDWGSYEIEPASASALYYGVSVGARYWFTEALGVNLEAGYGLSFLKAGINFRF